MPKIAYLTPEYWINIYKAKDALWIHDGNPKRPHAFLTSGKHSNGFFNSRLVIPDEMRLHFAAVRLLEMFTEQGGEILKIQGVVGPQTGATKLAELLKEEIFLQVVFGFPDGSPIEECFWSSPAKCENDGKKSMIFNERDLDLLPGKSILLCEDVLTTGGSVILAATAVFDAAGIVLPYVLTLVNRSGLKEIDGLKIIALIDYEMPMWEPDGCPLCEQGSEAIRPKGEENWARLNATY